MGGKLPRSYTHRPPGACGVSELRISCPYDPLRTPRYRAPRGLISACVFEPQGTLGPALYPRPAFTRAQSLSPFRPQRSVFQQKKSKAPIFERPQHSLLQTPIPPHSNFPIPIWNVEIAMGNHSHSNFHIPIPILSIPIPISPFQFGMWKLEPDHSPTEPKGDRCFNMKIPKPPNF